jgi:hypothetical protein
VSLVLDSSVTLAWVYSDEATEPIRRIFEAVADDGAVVPVLWRLEVANNDCVGASRSHRREQVVPLRGGIQPA